jgi:glycolate oxidase
VDELRQIVGKANVKDSGVDLQLYQYDAYLEERRPDAVVFVASTDEVAGVVRACNKYDVPFVPRGGGTNLSGGTIPFKGGIVLEMIRMNRILEVDRPNLRARVQPGLFNWSWAPRWRPSATSTFPIPRARRRLPWAATWPRTPAAPTASSTA